MKNKEKFSMTYLLVVVALTVILPTVSILTEWSMNRAVSSFVLIAGKWIIFWSVGMRLFIAGLRQAINPAFTSEKIFNITNPESNVIVRELGFANICSGLVGIMSLFLVQWRIPAAFGCGLYFGIAGINHLLKGVAGTNEFIALVSDVFIFSCMLVYLWQGIYE